MSCVGLDEQLSKGGQEDPAECAIAAAPSAAAGLEGTPHWPERLLGRCLAIVRVRVGAPEKWLRCALDRLPGSGEVGQTRPREDHRREAETQDVLVLATAGPS